ncbi:MAG: hypothetical protein R3F08_14735 [Dokdonella sp.]|nr:hypothetical protein [Xanthomonadales bacterium]MCB1573854.1 hypothetical protein [Xanthomonadales bacterium]MCB1576442.1 hypothetical protein [Xanthomonadales bacterium]
MSWYELVSVAQTISERIDVQWGFFLTVHMALLGGIIYVDRPLSRVEKTAAVFVYAVFATMSFRLLTLQQTLLERVYKDIVALRDDACCVGSHLMGFYVGEVESDFGRRIYIIAAALHALAFLLVVSSIISDRARRPD